jgi:hypothetical protein
VGGILNLKRDLAPELPKTLPQGKKGSPGLKDVGNRLDSLALERPTSAISGIVAVRGEGEGEGRLSHFGGSRGEGALDPHMWRLRNPFDPHMWWY